MRSATSLQRQIASAFEGGFLLTLFMYLEWIYDIM